MVVRQSFNIVTNKTKSFKELMKDLGTNPVVEAEKAPTAPTPIKISGEKKKLNSAYTFNKGWYDALLNTDLVLNSGHEQAQELALVPHMKRRILEIGVYEGASSCFWSDFYLDHPESRLISIDPFTGSEEHHAELDKHPELKNLELTARTNISKSKNAGKVEIIKGYSWEVFATFNRRPEEQKTIDVLYIDGAHDPVSVAQDTLLYAPFVAPGGLILFDDYGHPDVQRGVDAALMALNNLKFAVYTGWQLACKVKED